MPKRVTRVTIRNIDNALPAGYEIVRGNGCFCFFGDGEYGMTLGWPTSSVGVYHLTSYSIDEWVAEFMRLAKDYQPSSRNYDTDPLKLNI